MKTKAMARSALRTAEWASNGRYCKWTPLMGWALRYLRGRKR